MEKIKILVKWSNVWEIFFNKRLSPFVYLNYQLVFVLIMYSAETVTLKNNVTAWHLTSSTMELQYNLANHFTNIHLIIQFHLENCVIVQKNCVQTSKYRLKSIPIYYVSLIFLNRNNSFGTFSLSKNEEQFRIMKGTHTLSKLCAN